MNEIRLLGSLKHPNVVAHHETFLAGNKLHIVMELCPAGDLSGFIKAAASSRMPLPEQIIWQIFLQLCQGMNVSIAGSPGRPAPGPAAAPATCG